MTADPVPGGGDLTALRDLMDANESEDALSFAELPGFLFALACAPETVPPSEWLAEVWGDDAVFDDERQLTGVVGAVMTLYNKINAGVLERQPRLPDGYAFRDSVLGNFDPGSQIAAWARGFHRGHFWSFDAWDEYIAEEIEFELLVCVFGLSFFYSRERAQEAADDENQTLEELATRVRDQFEELMAAYAHVGRSIHEALMEHEGINDPPPRRPFVAEPSIGRNEPCPCGSGRKHKKCCGKHLH